MSEVVKNVEIAQLVKPKFITLAGKPANQIAFKVIRDDNGVETMANHIQRKRVKRSDSLIIIEFEVGMAEDACRGVMAEYGIEDYELVQEGDTYKAKKCIDDPAMKKKCSDTANTVRIDIGDGRFATILKPISNQASDTKSALTLTSVEFSADYFPDKADVSEWLKRNSIDFSDADMENGVQGIVVRSVKVEATEEVRRVQVDDGVQFVVARSDTMAMPDNFVTVVNDTAFGCWGWGQLDFAATMADKEFTEVASEACYALSDVVNRILFYGDVPVALRKDLIANAASQFSDFIGTLIDALPARVIVASRSIRDKEKLMSTKNGKPVERQDENKPTETPVAAAAAEGAAAASTETASITREDVSAMINEAVSGLSTQIAELKTSLTPVTRTEDPKEAEAGEKTPPAEDPAVAALKEVTRSITELGEVVKGISTRVESMEGTTTVRSDSGDGKQVTQRKDVFKGMFGSKE